MSADALLTLDKVAKRLAVSIRTVRLVDGTPAHPLMLPYSCVEPQEPPR